MSIVFSPSCWAHSMRRHGSRIAVAGSLPADARRAGRRCSASAQSFANIRHASLRSSPAPSCAATQPFASGGLLPPPLRSDPSLPWRRSPGAFFHRVPPHSLPRPSPARVAHRTPSVAGRDAGQGEPVGSATESPNAYHARGRHRTALRLARRAPTAHGPSVAAAVPS